MDSYIFKLFIKLINNEDDFIQIFKENKNWTLNSFKSFLNKYNKNYYTENKDKLEEINKKIINNKNNINYPDEFCDPLLRTPITEPCLLPESNIYIDKNSIIPHLLIDHTDPFNRSKLTLKMLEDYNNKPEVIKKIDIFKKKKKDWEDNSIQN